ncbi:ATP-grasp domain-containing protein [Streptomyces sp. NPDC089919]|uniref:ATP-grasp domain-containing protein n=1 Tax=Streptomyces sp. NPDC089919 TaxID=3155188 RepID=UPI003441D210
MNHPGSADRLLMVMPDERLTSKAVQAGFQVWAIWDPALGSAEEAAQVAAHARDVVPADLSDPAGLRATVARLVREHRIGHVLHLGGESGLAAVLAEAGALSVGPPGGAEAVRLLGDAIAMRRLLNRNGVSVVRARQADSVAEAEVLLMDFGLPAVIGPAQSDGGRYTALVQGADDLWEWTARVGAAGLEGPFLVQEYLEGPEFSVETLTVDAMHWVAGITARETLGPPGTPPAGHVHPAALSARDESAIRATVTALLDLAGYEFGPAHTTVVLTGDGPRITGCRARLGEDRIPLLVELATGFDLEAAVFRALAGQEVPESGPPTAAAQCAAIGFFVLPAGRLESVHGLEELRALDHVYALHFPYRPGDLLPEAADCGGRHGYAIVEAPTPGEAARRVTAVREALVTRVSPVGAEVLR